MCMYMVYASILSLQGCVSSLNSRGFINYYGTQRFGSLGKDSPVNSPNIGLAMLQEDPVSEKIHVHVHVNEWIDKLQEDKINVWTNEWMDGWMDRWMNGWMADEWMNGWMNGWMK